MLYSCLSTEKNDSLFQQKHKILAQKTPQKKEKTFQIQAKQKSEITDITEIWCHLLGQKCIVHKSEIHTQRRKRL